MQLCKGRVLGIFVAIAHGVFSGSLNILLKFLISNCHFTFLTLVQCTTSFTAAVTLEVLRRCGKISVPPYGLKLARTFVGVTIFSTLQSTLTLWSLRGLSLPMYVVFKRCLPLVTVLLGVLVLRNGLPSVGVIIAVLITTCGAALAGAGDLSGEVVGYITGVLAVLVHSAFLVIIQKTSTDSEHGPVTAQYIVAITSTPLLLIFSFASLDMIKAWSFPGWKDPAMVCTFIACTLIGCAMNFTTLHCTYINSAVTTSFVGVVKSIVTITVGMLAFDDVAPTSLFIAGVVVNTFGSLIYCVAKYFEMRRQINYEDLEKEAIKDEKEPQAGQPPPFVMEEILQDNSSEGNAQEKSVTETENPTEEKKGSTLAAVLKSHGPAKTSDEDGSSPLKDAYLGVWRMVRGTRFLKKDYLIENEELPSP
ncbi:solute carrier family 35 member D3 [Bufo bufo]|uniref:solute carrier family 35 member D3 n=1 Tax=Bufo bufo TaxID=8384 RepID=UPI001ABE8ED5|nr:solute carrier family 35 member D3 [Bufo bufo]